MKRRPQELLSRDQACHAVGDYISHFANPIRLRIICELAYGEASVTELVEATGARQPTVSQYLKTLRLSGIVDRTRDGNRIVYRLIDPLAAEMMEFIISLAERLVPPAGDERPECREVEEVAEARRSSLTTG